MLNPLLSEIDSIINGNSYASDNERVFTFIEFVKQFGYDNDPNIFVTAYKDYVTKWGEVKKNSIEISDDFVFTKLVDVLKSITLDYSTYEEQDFISHIDLKNEDQLKGLCALYSRKIKEIAEFYRKKRNESTLIVKKNSQKGSTKSIQEVIYEKIFDYLFSKRDIKHSFESIKKDLSISIENYVDTYSEYFDIPRKEKVSDNTRNEFLKELLQEYDEISGDVVTENTILLEMSSANENNIDDKVFLDDSQFAISDILFSGDVRLEEIPLVAKVTVDLSQHCVGDMLALKNQLTKNLTMNQLDLEEQVDLKKRLYEKFVGVDLWYCYVDEQGNVTIDMMCQAKNPTGNLLNVLNADTATIERSEWDDVIKDGKDDYLELLTHIGLFFKPDKTSILKVNAKNFTWSIDEDLLINDTLYIFPDPNKYGDIGNNKNPLYPLIMECNLDNEIKNISSGFAVNDPLLHIGSQGWYSYYSKQEDDFKIFDNKNYDYSFTSLANLGFATNYQTDIWGNEFCILKGCELGNGTLKIYSNYLEGGFKSKSNDIENNRQPVLLNGGYFRDIINKEEGFDYNRKSTLIDEVNDRLELSGLKVNNDGFYHLSDSNCISFGRFGEHDDIKYTDHFHTDVTNRNIISEEQIIEEISPDFFTKNDDVEVEMIDDISFDEISKKSGELYVKLLGQKPVKFTSLFNFIGNDEKIINFNIVSNIIVLETEESYIFFKYDYDGNNISESDETFIISKTKIESINSNGDKVLRAIDKTSLLYNESDKCFYLLLMETIDAKDDIGKIRRFLVPRIYKFDCTNYKMSDVLYLYDAVYDDELRKKNIYFNQKIEEKDKVVVNDSNGISFVKNVLLSTYDDNEYSNLSNFEIPYFSENSEIMEGSGFEVRFIQTEDKQLLNDLNFSYNSSLNTYLIAYTINDMNDTPYLYQHSFKIEDVKTFNDSLRSKVYTLKDDGENYKWNNDFNSEYVNSIPDAGNITNCIIWESYAGTGKANSGFFDTDYWDYENFEINITDFGSDNDSWDSYVYLWDEFEYKLLPQDNAQIVGKFEWVADFSSRIQQNQTIKDQYFLKCYFQLFNLMLKYENISSILDETSAKDCINEYIYDNSGNLVDKCSPVNVPNGSTDDVYVIEMYRDLIGNVSGSTHICVEKVINKKVIEIDINLQVSGTVDDIKPHVTIIAKQKKDNKVSDVIIEEDIVGGDESPSFSLSNNNINVYLHSEVYDYDNITMLKSRTLNPQKAIACDKNSWAFTFGHPDGKAHFGQNDCKLKIRNLMVVDCEEERDEYGIPKKVKENGKRLYVIKTDSVMSSILEIDFKLHIEKDKDGIEKVNARFEKGTITSAYIELADENMSSMGGEIYINLPDESNKSDDLFVCSFNYDEGKLDIHLYSTISINTCNYKCWISYNKFGVPYNFELDQMQNCTNIFSNTSSISLAWPFIDKSEETAKHVRLESAKNLNSICHGSTCSRFKVRNSSVEEIISVVSHTNKCFEFDIKKETELDNEMMSDALENVINAKHAFIHCHPSLDGVLNRYMAGSKNYSISSTTDLRHYAEAQQILISACPKNESLYNELKKSNLNETEWKQQFWDKAKSNIKDNYNPNFHYNMTNLRNAESMFYKKILHVKPISSLSWPDTDIKRYNVENVKSNNFTLQTTRIHDFESIKIAAPKLISAPLMFWNRPLNYGEAQFFVENVQDLTQEGSMTFSNQNIQKFYERITGKTNPSIREVFDDVMKLYTYEKIKDVFKEDYYDDEENTKQTDINYYNWLGKWIKPIIESESNSQESNSQYWDKKIKLFNRIITVNDCSPLRIKDQGNSTTYYSGIFPSISLPFEYPDNSSDEKKEIVNMLADKGWEVSTNLIYNSSSDVLSVGRGSNNYLFRAYEYGGTSGETFVTDNVFRNNTTQKQDYLIDACKSVIKPITCDVTDKDGNHVGEDSYDFWVKLCMAWKNVSAVNSNWQGRNINNVSQILGERTSYGNSPGVTLSKACIFTGDDNKYYCKNTWFNGSLSNFKNHFGFTFIYD